jgi:hypothetical protein
MKRSEALREPDIIDREEDLRYIANCVASAECCSVVGISNIGKSTLLRAASSAHLLRPSPERKSAFCVYIDCNLTSQVTEQGFYEVILRNLLQALERSQGDAELRSTIRKAYDTVIAKDNPFLVPLAFEDSLEAFFTRQPEMLVLLFDEFDEILAELEPRVFVRLRALKDRFWSRLSYVTATGRPLPEVRHDRQVGEFCELFATHTHHLAPLSRTAARSLVERYAAQRSVTFNPDDIEFLLECSDGHPALLQATCRAFDRARQEGAWRPSGANYESLRQQLASDSQIRLECAKLWTDLSAQEQQTLIQMVGGEEPGADLDTLIEKGLVRTGVAGTQLLNDLFAGFVRRQQLMRKPGRVGVRVDVEAGNVWVDDQPVPTLTESEYKLLLLLYGNLDKICDKYKIVESVWGESFIDEVDDARIEKLVSRLRQKIEPQPDQPKHVITIRGRGYKLVSPA